MYILYNIHLTILLTKTTAAQNEAALSYHRVRGLYFLAVVFVSNKYNSYYDTLKTVTVSLLQLTRAHVYN